MAEEKGKKEVDSKEDAAAKTPDTAKRKKMLLMASAGGGILLVVLVVVLMLVLKPAKHNTEGEDGKEKTSESAAADKKAEAEPEKEVAKPKVAKKRSGGNPIFLSIDPAFVVNIPGGSRMRMMQIRVQLMARDQKELDIATANMPLIQNVLVRLFGSKTFEEVNTPEGKEQLRTDSLKEILAVLGKEGIDSGIEEVLFTSFVMQ